VKGEEMVACVTAIFHEHDESEPPRPRDGEATKEAKKEEEAAMKVEVDAAKAAVAAEPAEAEAETEAPLLPLSKGTRLSVFWEDEEPPTWFDGCVIGFGLAKGHHIRYDDGDWRWEKLEHVRWKPIESAPAMATDAPVAKREAPEVVAIPSEAQAGVRLTRSKRREVKVLTEDVVDGLVRCPGCGGGIQMADGGCNVTTCYNTANHGGRYYYFCAHCRAECPDGESMCMSCPSHNDRQTRVRVKARRDKERHDFLGSNSMDNPCEID